MEPLEFESGAEREAWEAAKAEWEAEQERKKAERPAQ